MSAEPPAPTPTQDDLEDTQIGLPALRDDDCGPDEADVDSHLDGTHFTVVVPLPAGYGPGARLNAAGRRRNDAVGLDRVTPILLVAWAVGTVVMFGVQFAQIPADANPLVLRLARSTLWATYLTKVLTFATVVAPLCWLAVVVAGKVMRFELPHGAYLKAAGVAALPEVALLCVQRFAPDNAALRALLAVGILPLAFLLLKFVYDLRPTEALVAYGLGLTFFAAGWFASSVLIGAVVASGLVRTEGEVRLAAAAGELHTPDAQESAPRGDAPATDRPAAVPPAVPVPPIASSPSPSQAAAPADPATDVGATVVAPLRSRVEALAGLIAAGEQAGPEQATTERQAVERELAAAKAKYPGRPEWPDLDRALAAAGSRLAALPPATPPATLFEPAPADVRGFDPLPGGGGAVSLADEVSFAGFRFRPPADVRLDLDVAWETRSTIAYALERSPAKLSVALVPRANRQQRRPFTVTHAYQRPAAQSQGLFVAADLADLGPGAKADVSYGLLNGEPFTRVVCRPSVGGDPARDATVYAALVYAEYWLVARVAGGPQKDPLAAIAFEAAVRTLRRAKPGEPTADPYAPARVAAQFPADPTRVGALFRRQPAAAEPFAVRYLAHADAGVRRAAVELLPAVASPASVPQLLPLAASPDPEVAAGVRAALRRLAPTEFDVVAEAAIDLRSDDWGRRERALDALLAAGATRPAATLPGTAPAAASAARRREVAAELEALVVSEQAPTSAGVKAARLLGEWGSPGTVRRLARTLDAPDVPSSVRDRLIAVLAGTQDRTAAAAMLRWVVQAPDPVVAGLSRMGAAAEDEVIRAINASFVAPAAAANAAAPAGLSGPNGPAVRQACVRVLREIGTPKCLDALGRCHREARDFPSRVVVKDAMDQVRTRVAAAAKASAATRPE